ncbi:DUF354 domain-containing protein [soil metagenome]
MKVWVDCTAAPHPLVLRPIIDRLRERGDEVEITAREYGQTIGILDRLGLEHTVVGTHSDGSLPAKGASTASRSLRLLRWARPHHFDLAIAHGSVDIAVVGPILRIPTAQMQDYEFAGMQRRISWGVAKRVLVPDAIPVERLIEAGAKERKLVRYPGLKEDYYLTGFEPDDAVMSELGLDRERVIVVMRPPPESSAYGGANPLYDGVLDHIAAAPNATAIVIPRTPGQRQAALDRAARGESVVVPEHAIDAQSLIAFSDLVVSAGGTMNREAVALGTPVYTIFGGKMGAVDEQLIAGGMLRELGDPGDLALEKRSQPAGVQNPRDPSVLVEGVLAAAR